MGYTELHRHLDASIRPSTLAKLVRQFNVESPVQSEDDVRSSFWITSQMSSLKEVLDCFVLFQRVLRTFDVLEQITVEAIEDAKLEGISRLELRYSPTFASEHSKLEWNKSLAAILRGIDEGKRRTGLDVGLICIASRGYGADDAHRTIEFAIENRQHFIGVDLAGDEINFPGHQYIAAFRKARDAAMPITIHAGEASGPESVWTAIDELGATRIGHGINSIHDKELVKRLARDKILLETCPTSNYITRCIDQWQDHPLPHLLEAGIPVSVSTDDPGIFGTTMEMEYSRCRQYLGLSDGDLKRIDQYAAEHSFLNHLTQESGK